MPSMSFPTTPENLFVVGNNFIYDESRFHRYVTARVIYAATLPAFLAKDAIELIRGMLCLSGVVASLGLWNKSFNQRVFTQLDDTFRNLLVHPYACLIKILNPTARAPITIDKSDEPAPTWSLLVGSHSKNFWVRHFVTRGCIPLILTIRTIKRLIDLAVGLICAALSICALGHSKFLNKQAFKRLECCVIIKEIVFYSLLFINPWAVESGDVLERDPEDRHLEDLINLDPQPPVRLNLKPEDLEMM